MKKLFVLSAIAVLAACGGSDNKPATDPSTTSSTPPADTSAADPAAAPSDDSSAAPASTDAPPADAPKK